ncbi:hypothetical protein ACJRO7_016952 [Eucalyptus globulus]|uniref:B box-type domain-containing protein n=1 Tax=Eucalyptus globulus TaxID=34317 RepID=A0ABD3KUX7_EUCGL
MMGNDATVVWSRDYQKNVVPPWLRPIASTKFYSPCKTHLSEERSFYCSICVIALCEECKKQHDLCKHDMIKVPTLISNHLLTFRQDASFRMEDLRSLWDTSGICKYTSNRCLVAFVPKRGDGIARSHGQRSVAMCESCQYQLKSLGAKYCSVECKVEAVMKMNGSGSTKNEAKMKVETVSEGSSGNVESFRKGPRKQKSPQRAPFFLAEDW